jgi:hypothetical protein
MPTFNFDGFVKIVVLVLIAGLAIGLLTSDTDLANFIRNQAEAEKQHIANQRQAAQDAIDLANYEIERQAQARIAVTQAEGQAKIAAATSEAEAARIRANSAAEVTRINEAVRMQIALNNLRLAAEVAWMVIKLVFALTFGLVVCYALLRVLFRLASHVPMAAPKHPTTPWQDEAFRKQMREHAKERERQARRPETPQRIVSGNGRHPQSVPETLTKI